MSSRHGFSLVSVLITASVLGLVAIGGMSMLDGAMMGQKGTQNSQDFDLLRNSLKLVLSNHRFCNDAFWASDGVSRAKYANPPLAPGQGVGVIKLLGQPVMALNQGFSHDLKVTRIDLLEVTPPIPVGPTGRRVSVKLIFSVEQEGKKGISSAFTNEKNPFYFEIEINPADEIVGCSAGYSGYIGSATIGNGDLISLPTGYSKEQCSLLLFGRDLHHGPVDTLSFAKLTGVGPDYGWSKSTHGGYQTFYTDNSPNDWIVTCRYALKTNYSATATDNPAVWFSNSIDKRCQYLMVCR